MSEFLKKKQILVTNKGYERILKKEKGVKEKMEDCVFCKLIKGDIPSKKVYEDEDILAFKDIHPAAPIHILVIPKKHIATLMQVTQEDSNLMDKILEVIQKVAKQLEIEEKGFRLIANCGPDSGQEVMHVHFHLLAGRKMGPKIIS